MIGVNMKKKSKVISLIVASIVIFSAIVCAIIYGTYDREFEEYIDTFDDVTKTISEMSTADAFVNSDDDKKVTLIKDCLEGLEKEGKIKNIGYSNFVFSFNYPYNNIKSGIVIKDTYEDDCWGTSNVSTQKLTANQNIVTESISKSDSDIQGQQWSFVLGATIDESLSNQFNYIASEYDNPISNINFVDDSDVSTYMEFADSDLIYISAHGFYDDSSSSSIIWTEEEVTKQKQKKKEYKKLLNNGSIASYIKLDGDHDATNDKSYFVILPGFFQNYYSNNELENSIVMFGVCCLFGDNNSENYDFYNSLKNAGASTVIGACNSINQSYSFLFYEKVLNCYLSGQSIAESFEEAQNVVGKDENEYFNKFPEFEIKKDNQPGYFILCGERDLKFNNYDQTNWGQYGITIKDSETQNPIKDVRIEVTKENGIIHIYQSDLNGFCKFVLPSGKYTCKLSCNEYDDKTIEINVEKNVITSLKDAVLMKPSFEYEKVYYQYIKNNLAIIDYDTIPNDSNTGVFSALIEDFDDDNIKEMVIFSYENVNGGSVVLQLYKYMNDTVKLYDTSETIYASGGGNFSNNMCGTIENKVIKIQYDNYGFGGSSHGMTYMSYKIENNRFVMINNYSLSEFYKYDQYDYKETVSGKSFLNENDFIDAVKSAKYDVKSHLHVGYSDSKFNPETDDYKNNDLFKGNHIFTLVNSNSMIKSGEYGFIYDNTDLKNQLGVSSVGDNTIEKEKIITFDNIKDALIKYYWKNNIQSPHVYEFKDDNTVIEYDALPDEPKSTWSYCSRGTYSIKNNKLIVSFSYDYGEYSFELQYLTLKENIDWDTGLYLEEQLKDNEYFFYEVDFEPATNGPTGNAFYLQKGIKK